MNHKYIVTLTDDERKMLRGLIEKGRTQGYRIKHAQILLKLDEIPENQEWTYAKIKEAYHATPHTICQIAKRFVTGGVEAALGRKEQVNRHKKIDGRVEAHIIAIACSEVPEGRERWTLQLIADELVRLGVVESISDTAVMETLKKTNLTLAEERMVYPQGGGGICSADGGCFGCIPASLRSSAPSGLLG